MFTIAKPFASLAQSKFGGLYTEVDPRNLPLGASPLCHDVDFTIAGIGIRPSLSIQAITVASGSFGIFQMVKEILIKGALREGASLLLAKVLQDASGNIWGESLATPGTYNPIHPIDSSHSAILNGARMLVENINDRGYMPLSDFTEGRDQPLQWDGLNVDRISQVGPGTPPLVPSSASSQFTIINITQPDTAKSIDSIAWGSSINLFNAQQQANTLWFLGTSSSFTSGLNVGDVVYVSGAGTLEGLSPNGTYAVVSVGTFSQNGVNYWYFGVVGDQINADFARGTAGGTYQKTQAVIQLSNPLPAADAQVGLDVTVSGNSVSGWNSTWKITGTPAEGQLSVTATALTSNIATYTFTLQSGNAPGWQASKEYVTGSQIVDNNGSGHVWQVTTPGTSGGVMPTFPASPAVGATVTDGGVTWTYQSGATMQVTVFNTANGNGIFNVSGLEILSATSSTFTVAITNANVTSASEEGQAVSGSGSVLLIDPGLTTIGTGHPGTNPVLGTGTGGTVVSQGTGTVAAGVRYAILMFETRNEYITQGSPPVKFFTTGASTSLTFTQVATGPPNIIRRIIAMTLANADIEGPYFYIPQDVQVPGSGSTLGQTTLVNKTVIEDNTSTTLGPITLDDATLAASVDVTAVGNNRLQVRELGECVKCTGYAGRAIYIGERVKVDGFLNPTFDGGVLGQTTIPTPQLLDSAFQHGLTNSLTLVLPGGPPATTDTLVFFAGYRNVSPDTQTITPPASLSGATHYVQSSANPGSFTEVWVMQGTDGTTNSWTFGFVATLFENVSCGVARLSRTNTVTVTHGSATLDGVHISTGAFAGASKSMALVSFQINASGLIWTPASYTSLWGESPSIDNVLVGTSPGPTIAAGPVMVPYAPTSPPVSYFVVIASGTPGSSNGQPTGWTVDSAISSYVSIVNSPIVNTSLQINNTSGAALSGSIYQKAFLDAFGSPIIQPNTDYSVRITAMASAPIASGNLIVEMFSASTGTWRFIIPLSSLTTSIHEFIGDFNNPLWTDVPSDLLYRITLDTMPNGATVLIDRTEVYPTFQPYYATQAAVSYLEDEESIDRVTGVFDISRFTSKPIRNCYKFLDQVYIGSYSPDTSQGGRTFRTTDQTGTEPSGWDIREISNTVGDLGPMCAEAGEEYTLVCARPGAYIFDGGNHIKISQEVQQIWDSIYWPSAGSIWVSNDIEHQRILIGVPLPTPNPWLPNAATNATPATPNVVLACSYLSLPNGAAIAGALAVEPSMFTGHLLWREGRRKWTLWQIPAPAVNYITDSTGEVSLWLPGTTAGTLYEMREPITARITAFQITSNVVTVTAQNGFVVGEKVIVNGLSVGTYLNGQILTVASATALQFTAAFTHADVALTADAGKAVNSTDNGAAIPEVYTISPLPDSLTESQMDLTPGTRKMFPYATALIEGAGSFTVTAWPENLNAPPQWAFTQAPFTLSPFAVDDQNIPLTVSGNRIFLVFATDGNAGSYFSLRKTAAALLVHPRLGVTGR